MPARGAAPLEALPEGLDRRRPLPVVGRVHVDVQGLAARGLDPGLDLFDVGQTGPEVEVDAGDLVAGSGEGTRRRLAHPARRAEDQRPSLAVVGHGGRV